MVSWTTRDTGWYETCISTTLIIIMATGLLSPVLFASSKDWIIKQLEGLSYFPYDLIAEQVILTH